MAAKKENKFIKGAFEHMNLSDEERAKIEFETKVKRYTQELKGAINLIEVKDIEILKSEVEKEESMLEIFEEENKNNHFDLKGNLQEYIESLRGLETARAEKLGLIAGLKNNIESLKEEAKRLKAVLKTLEG